MINASKINEIQKIISLKVSSLGFEVSTSVFITKAIKMLVLFVAKSCCIDFFILLIIQQRGHLCQWVFRCTLERNNKQMQKERVDPQSPLISWAKRRMPTMTKNLQLVANTKNVYHILIINFSSHDSKSF